ncbi:hypothetical protein DMC30DRAFT_406654 [Rhodotorula diobovata]|uniref:Cyclin-like domain-containing protein n=1 Tax=Rhodotorula diobovata TaxID=5288 RepID=A0A5C5FMG1_9BASI|nr:hypothetical protein DMC30DRAFT_406654 [Rhodotorula diobovata]
MASLELPGVPPPAPPPAPDAPPPLAVTRDFRPYYSPVELDYLVRLQAQARQPHHSAPAPATTTTLSDHRIQHYRQLACGFIERVAARLGFPRRTIATAQKLYHRFHLHFPITDFAYQDVSLSALLVASKLEDTLKKLREIQIAAWQVSNLLEGGPGLGEGDPAAQEAHRPHLIGIERLLLQTICFNFNLHRSLDPAEASTDALLLAAMAAPPPTRDAFTYLVRLAHALPSLPAALLAAPAAPSPSTPAPPPTPASEQVPLVLKSLTYAAFLLLTDLHRTLAPLSYPPHTCAAACVYLAGFMLVAAARRGDAGGADAPEREGEGEGRGVWDGEVVRGWATSCESEDEDIDDIALTLLDLLIHLCPSPSSTSTSSTSALNPTSPLFSPSSASPSDSLPPAAAAPPGSGSSSSKLSERAKHLLATGVPNTFAAHPVLGPSASVDGLTGVKILLRRAREAHPPGAGAGARARKRARPALDDPVPAPSADADADAEEEEETDADAEETPALVKRSRRWAHLAHGLADVGRARDERANKERVRAEERAERERGAASAGVGAGEGGGGEARTEEERERERRERRERLRPGSVRYRF